MSANLRSGALSGKRILVTRSADQANALAEPLAAHGASPVLCPTIEIVPPPSYAGLDAALTELESFDYLILTSVNAVSAFFARLHHLGLSNSSLTKITVVAVGPKTADAIARQGVSVDLVPDDFRAEGVVTLLGDRVTGKRLLYPKAALARDLIPRELTAQGADVIEPVAYDSAPPAESGARLKEALAGGLDLITFTASSTVRNLVDLTPEKDRRALTGIPVASIGPLTTATAEKLGFTVTVEPDNSTLDDMVEAISNYFGTRDAGRGTR